MRRALAIAVGTLSLTGCGGSDALSRDESDRTSLDIEVRPEGEAGEARRYHLDCDPAGGTLPGAERACTLLAALPATAWDPVAADAMCTEQYGGPQVAWVTGTFRGAAVDARFARTNGCEISRWTTFSFLFPET